MSGRLVSLFEQAIQENPHLLVENVGRRKIITSIENREVVKIYYAGDHIVNKGWRHIEPYVYGLTKKENPAVRAWQRKGVTDTPENMPGWRMFRVDRIYAWNETDETFDAPRELYNPEDKDMLEIYAAANFEGVAQKEPSGFWGGVKSLFNRIFKK